VSDEEQSSLTDEWVEYFEQCKAVNDIRSIFWKMHDLHGPPDGVDAEDPRVKSALEEIRKANAGCGCPE
jgi:hypothetical protein